MSENDRIKDEQVKDVSREVENLLDGMSDRINETVENIAELADDIEQLSGQINSLLNDLRAIQSKIGRENKDKLEPLMDQLEGVSKELETALWTMDCATEGLPEDVDLLDVFEQQSDSPD